jgi:uncharacterized protein YndB with AHSA1/START domain
MNEHQDGYAELEDASGLPRLRFVRRFRHPVDKVWRALTDTEELDHWFPTTIEGDRVDGAALRFRFRPQEFDNPPDEMHGEILVWQPCSVLVFTWSDHTLRFELVPEGDGSTLTFTDTFHELGIAARDGAGWHVCLDSLDLLLHEASHTSRQSVGWRERNAVYAERFGPEASSIGPPPGVPLS